MVKVSVIIPIYNSGKYLKTCIDGIIMQSFHDIEIILVDDGSTDQSGKICDDYLGIDKRIKVVHHHTNAGVTKARQTGILHSTGEYLVFVDSDDSIKSNYIEQLMGNIGNFQLIIGSISHEKAEEVSRYNFIKGLLCDWYVWGLPGKLYHRSLFNQNIMNTPRSINIGEDLIENIKIARQIDTVLLIPSDGYRYTVNPDSVTHTRTWSLSYEEEFMNEVEKALGQDLPYYRDILWIFKVHTWKNLVLHGVKVDRTKKWTQWILDNKPQNIVIGIGDKAVLNIKNHYLAMIALKVISYVKQIKYKFLS